MQTKMPRKNYFDKTGGPSSCGISGLIHTQGGKVSMSDNIAMAVQMEKDRCNGLGAGFALYDNELFEEGLRDCYALQFFLMDGLSYGAVKKYLSSVEGIELVHDEPIPTKNVNGIIKRPGLHRFF